MIQVNISQVPWAYCRHKKDKKAGTAAGLEVLRSDRGGLIMKMASIMVLVVTTAITANLSDRR